MPTLQDIERGRNHLARVPREGHESDRAESDGLHDMFEPVLQETVPDQDQNVITIHVEEDRKWVATQAVISSVTAVLFFVIGYAIGSIRP